MGDALPALAGAFLQGARASGIEPDASLRILRCTPDLSAAPVAGPGELGPRYEELLTGSDRTTRGAWYTPPWMAAELVARAVPDRVAAERGTVFDPACGGGAFLLAAADRLVELGDRPGDAIRMLRGRDVDPIAVAVTEASLWWWSASRDAPTVAGPDLAVGDALGGQPWGAHGTVVGNPPFLGQLRTSTAMDERRRAALRGRFGAAMRPYTDPAWLFLIAAVESLVPGGRAALVQPQSLLAARDAAAVRAIVDECAALVDTFVDPGSAFDAAVSVCAPVLERRAERRTVGNDWVGPLADARGVPVVELRGAGVLGDIATVHAGFRDEYYGLVDAVTDGGAGPRLVTAGAIDPFRVLDRPQRFANRRWADPRIDPTEVVGRAARWLAVQRGPKVLVATQTRVVEAVADEDGDLVGSVPVVVVRPRDPAALWHVLAALQAPAVSAWLLRRSAGTALSADACRPTASLLASVPLPIDDDAWERAAELARAAAAGDADLERFTEAVGAAYAAPEDELRTWWRQRLPRR